MSTIESFLMTAIARAGTFQSCMVLVMYASKPCSGAFCAAMGAAPTTATAAARIKGLDERATDMTTSVLGVARCVTRGALRVGNGAGQELTARDARRGQRTWYIFAQKRATRKRETRNATRAK